MGMFDYIRCHYKLPDGFTDDIEYQTKDTDEQFLCHYTITEAGRLILHSERYEETPKEKRPFQNAPEDSPLTFFGAMTRVQVEDIEVPFHGALTFYTGNHSGSSAKGYITPDDSHGWWREYTALFDRGQLLKIEGGLTMDEQSPITHEEFWKDDKPNKEA